MACRLAQPLRHLPVITKRGKTIQNVSCRNFSNCSAVTCVGIDLKKTLDFNAKSVFICFPQDRQYASNGAKVHSVDRTHPDSPRSATERLPQQGHRRK